ncbi:hypothetical protein ANO11243_011810 [Dothideomycetidae sp. 11243]|nr:hypothetical protein ANO11243_011810 [fungal sp. No.11243]
MQDRRREGTSDQISHDLNTTTIIPSNVHRNDYTHDDDDVDSLASDEAPIHPVPAMQDAFEESIREATEAGDTSFRSGPDISAEARRKELLDRTTYDASWTTRWKQRPGARCHPIVKLMSQIIFGLHLLHQEQARSDTEVVEILQTHVDDIDDFLEKTTEDFDLAIKDIEERIGFLKLPMSHMEVFDNMLGDRKFRAQLVEGNEQIEQIIERTAKAMNAVMMDIQKAVNTTQQLAEYLERVSKDWPHDRPESSAVFAAMKGNEQGWKKCLRDLQVKGNQLGVDLVRLGTVVGEMNRLAASASKRSPAMSPPSPDVPVLRDVDRRPRSSADGGRDKPLPKEPDAVGVAVQATIPPVRPIFPAEQRSTSDTKKTLATKKSAPAMNRMAAEDTNLPRRQSVQLNAPQNGTVKVYSKPTKPTLKIPSSSTVSSASPLSTKSSRSALSQDSPASRPTPATLGIPSGVPSGFSQSLPSSATSVPIPAPLQVHSHRSRSRSRSTSRGTNNINEGQKSRHARQGSHQTSISQSTAPSMSSASSSRAPSHHSRPSQSSSIGDVDFSFNTVIESGRKSRSRSQSRNPSQPGSISGSIANQPFASAATPIYQSTSSTPVITIDRASTDHARKYKTITKTSPLSATETNSATQSVEPAYEEIIIQPPFMFLPPIVPLEPLTQLSPMQTPTTPSSATHTAPTYRLGLESDNQKSFDQDSRVEDSDLALMGHGARTRQELIRSKTDPAYVLNSEPRIKSPLDSPPLTATRVPSRLGLFPVTSAPSSSSPPASRSGPSSGPTLAPRPKPSVTFEKSVMTLPPVSTTDSVSQKQGRLGKLFKRKVKDEPPSIRVSPN